jgi:hypothetical protein
MRRFRPQPARCSLSAAKEESGNRAAATAGLRCLLASAPRAQASALYADCRYFRIVIRDTSPSRTANVKWLGPL